MYDEYEKPKVKDSINYVWIGVLDTVMIIVSLVGMVFGIEDGSWLYSILFGFLFIGSCVFFWVADKFLDTLDDLRNARREANFASKLVGELNEKIANEQN